MNNWIVRQSCIPEDWFISSENLHPQKFLYNDGTVHTTMVSDSKNNYWSSKQEAQLFLDKWNIEQEGSKMNAERISQCKADIGKLEQELTRLQKEADIARREAAIPKYLEVGMAFEVVVSNVKLTVMVHWNGCGNSMVCVPFGGWTTSMSGTFAHKDSIRIKLVDLDAKYLGYFCNLYERKV